MGIFTKEDAIKIVDKRAITKEELGKYKKETQSDIRTMKDYIKQTKTDDKIFLEHINKWELIIEVINERLKRFS